MFNKSEHNKKYWAENGHKYNARLKAKYASDPSYRKLVLDKRKEWIKKNPEKYRLQLQRTKGRRLKMRFDILKRDDFTCQYCGRKAPSVVLHVDHILAKANGGLNRIENYITACAECNNGKSDCFL